MSVTIPDSAVTITEMRTCRLRRYRHARDPAGEAPWREGGNDHQHGQCRTGAQPWRRRGGRLQEAGVRDSAARLRRGAGRRQGGAIEKSVDILKARGKIVSLVGPLDVAFARARRLNIVLTLVFALMSRKITRLAKKRDVDYSFLFARPDGDQLAQIGKLLETQRIRPVIDKVLPFEQAREALECLARGRSKGKVVVKMC